MIVRATLVVAIAVMAVLVLQGPPPEQGSAFVVQPQAGVKRRKSPLVLIPGNSHGGWVFRAAAQKLAAEGWTVHCITNSKERFKTLDKYLEEIRRYIAEQVEDQPILIGHSLGGMFVSQYLLNDNMDQAKEKRAIGAVFLSTFANSDFLLSLRSTLSVFRASLAGCAWATLRLNARHVMGLDKDASKRILFAPGSTSTNIAGEGEERIEEYLDRLAPLDSGVVVMDLLRRTATKPHRALPEQLQIPTLAVIPGKDSMVFEWSQLEHARTWGSEILRVEGQGHMLGDAGWEFEYAEPFAAWLANTFA